MRLAALVLLLATPALLLAQLRSAAVPRDNTFVGLNAGSRSIAPSATENTAVGAHSFAQNSTGAENTALGANALWSNSDGMRNTAIGYVALAGNLDGIDNVALGHSAMYKNESGAWNVAIGLQALYMNTTGLNNTAVGRDAVFSNTTGSWNTGIGVDAIPGVETGSGNTAVGGESGYTEDLNNQNVTGSLNTWIGYQAGPSSPAQHDGVIGIGYQAKTSKDYQAVLGSPRIVETLLYGNVGINAANPQAALVVNGTALNTTGVWGVYSDARLKSDIEDYDAGLEVVRQLNPVTFRYNGLEGLATDETQIGLVAQDVERVAPYMVSRHEGAELDDVRVMSPQALPYLLINAIQELEAKVAELERQLAERDAR
jgi:trimeric autotransporter adhesin